MPRFVLLEHAWNGVHWDLMLEREPGGLLCTWAFDAPVVPGVDLPARALADHRRAYLEYEGPVSGDRGSVRRVAAGTYRALAWTEGEVRVDLNGDQLCGVAVLRRTVGPKGEEPGVRASAEGADRVAGWIFRLGNCD